MPGSDLVDRVGDVLDVDPETFQQRVREDAETIKGR